MAVQQPGPAPGVSRLQNTCETSPPSLPPPSTPLQVRVLVCPWLPEGGAWTPAIHKHLVPPFRQQVGHPYSGINRATTAAAVIAVMIIGWLVINMKCAQLERCHFATASCWQFRVWPPPAARNLRWLGTTRTDEPVLTRWKDAHPSTAC